MIDYEAKGDEVEHFDALTHDQVKYARRTAANYAKGETDEERKAEMILFWQMLGIHPDQEEETCNQKSLKIENSRSPSEALSKRKPGCSDAILQKFN